MEWGTYQTAPVEQVYSIQYRLFEMFQMLKEDLRVP